MLPEPLTRLLRAHRDTHAPLYPPNDNSDHGPMAYLAMHGLGIEFDPIQQFAARYRRTLVPLGSTDLVVDANNWQQCFGNMAAYGALLNFFDASIDARGWRATLQRFLPSLISGWVKDAFHPIIRLGYGIEFECPSEVAAGLAYMTCIGDDPSLLEQAALASNVPSAHAALAELRMARRASFSRGPFNARYDLITDQARLAVMDGDLASVLQDVSRTGLEVFHATHDFFALHLITASHAFRICSPWGGDGMARLFSAGIGAAYLAIGAPPFADVAAVRGAIDTERIARATDEHDIKLAYSARAQARAWHDPTYEWCAQQYLAPRLSGAP